MERVLCGVLVRRAYDMAIGTVLFFLVRRIWSAVVDVCQREANAVRGRSFALSILRLAGKSRQ